MLEALSGAKLQTMEPDPRAAMERVQRTARHAARRAFADAVSSLPGTKTLFVEETLYDIRTSSALCVRAFADAKFLEEHGVRDVVPFPSIRAEKLLRVPRAAIFLLRGASARGASAIVNALRGRNSIPASSSGGTVGALKCLVLVTPRASPTVQRELQRDGAPPLRIKALPLGFLPYDADVLSLDWPTAYRDFVLNGDSSAIRAAARGLAAFGDLLKLEYAPIRSAGPAAVAVAEDLLETHGHRYARLGSRRIGHSGSEGSSHDPSSSAQNTAFIHRPFGGAFAQIMGSKSDVADDASIAESEFYAYSDVGSAVESGRSRSGRVGIGLKNDSRTEVSLVLIDRGVDIVSALLSQWTYEGLLDESLGLGNNTLVVPVGELKTDDASAVFRVPEGSTPEASIMTLKLRADSDKLFAQVRDMSYWAASSRIGEVASGVKEYYSARPERESAEIARVRDYVVGLKEKKSEHRRASEHLALAAEISARTFEHIPFKRRFEFERELIEGGNATVRKVYVGEAIARGESLQHVLRLACLWSVTSAGIERGVLDFVRREIVASYGLRVLPLLANLERAGLLRRSLRAAPQTSWLGIAGFGGSTTPNEVAPVVEPESSDLRSVRSYRSNATAGSRTPSRAASMSPMGSAGAPAIKSLEHSWQFARAALRLVTRYDPEHEDGSGDADKAAAPYLGYTPMSVRLIEAAMSSDGWSRLPPVAPHTALLPLGHAAVEHRAASLVTDATRDTEKGSKLRGAMLPFDTVVMFVGGVTRAEASAVRLAAKAAGKRVLIATTHVVSANEFISSFAEDGFYT